MINITAAFLSRNSLWGQSPIVQLQFCRVRLSDSLFSHSISAFTNLDYPIDLAISRTRFSNSIGNFVYLSMDSCSAALPATLSAGATLNISDCAFTGYTSFTYLIYSYQTYATVCVVRCSFTNIIYSSAKAIICIDMANCTTILSSTFSVCQLGWVTSYALESHIYNIPFGYMNDTVESQCGISGVTTYSSFFGARTFSLFCRNNATKNIVASTRSGFCFTNCQSSSPIALFCQANGCHGTSFVSFNAGALTSTIGIECISFVNNTMSAAYIEVGSPSTANFTLCTFYGNSAVSSLLAIYASYYISFVDCIFDISSALTAVSVTYTSCDFGVTLLNHFLTIGCDAASVFGPSHAFSHGVTSLSFQIVCVFSGILLL